MATWTSAEDEVLSDTIIDYLKRGASITDAIVKSAKQLNRPIESVNGRWYDHLQTKHKDDTQFIRSNVKRINDYVGEWTNRDDERLMHTMTQLVAHDVKTTEALNQCAHSLGRSKSSCSNRWYTFILKRHKLTIEEMIMEVKRKMTQVQTYTIPRNWEENLENIAVSIMLQTLKSGETVQAAMEKVSKDIEKPISSVRTYWYTHLLPEHEKAVDKARGQKSFWDNEKRFELYAFIRNKVASGTGITKTIKLAGEHFNRAAQEAHSLWYAYLNKDESLNKRYVAYQNKINGEKPATTEQTQNNLTDPNFKSFEKVEDEIILEAVLESIQAGRRLPVAYSNAAGLIQRPSSEIEARWRNILQYEYIDKVTAARNSEKHKAPEVPSKVDTTAQVVEQEQQDVQQPEVKIEIPQVTGFDITKVTEFLAQIQNLVSENKRLTADNATLKSKADKYDEMEAQNKQLSAAVERARQFLSLELPSIEAEVN